MFSDEDYEGFAFIHVSHAIYMTRPKFLTAGYYSTVSLLLIPKNILDAKKTLFALKCQNDHCKQDQ